MTRVSDSCGFGVPELAFVRDREQFPKSHANKGEAGLEAYRRAKNGASVDGLRGI